MYRHTLHYAPITDLYSQIPKYVPLQFRRKCTNLWLRISISCDICSFSIATNFSSHTSTIGESSLMSNFSAISTTTHFWSCKIKTNNTVCLRTLDFHSMFPYIATRFHCVTVWVRGYHSNPLECCEGYVRTRLFQLGKPKLKRSIEFIDQNPGLVKPENAMAFISDDGGLTYNRCHCKALTFVPIPIWANCTTSSLEQLWDW